MSPNQRFVCIRRISRAIKEILTPLVKWRCGGRIKEITNGFYDMKKLKNVIGAIDGTHIQISGQSFCNENYINRKGFPSIVLQAVCDHQFSFTDCYCGWPGSVHDARVFQNCDLLARIESNPMDIFPENTHLVGDGAYQSQTWMLTPYKERTSLEGYQANYNYVQSATRNIIERAFALLKGRFQCQGCQQKFTSK